MSGPLAPATPPAETAAWHSKIANLADKLVFLGMDGQKQFRRMILYLRPESIHLLGVWYY